MAKRSENVWHSGRVNVEEESVKEIPKTTVRVVLTKNKIVNYTGKITGNRYTFNGAGSVVEVDERDVPVMLEIGINQNSCCSGLKTSPYFQIV
jgi:hypothetical protein